MTSSETDSKLEAAENSEAEDSGAALLVGAGGDVDSESHSSAVDACARRVSVVCVCI
jgi:hypothetical protein